MTTTLPGAAEVDGGQNDRDEWEDSSSVDTNDAFMEMLGFSAERPESLDVAEHIESPKSITIKTTCTPAGACLCKPIKVPIKCSRHRVDPSECLALVIDNVLSEDQCQRIVQMAGTGFRYITEASHKTSDGTSYTVEIQNPNPHKLSAIDTDHNPQFSKVGSKPKDAGTLLMDHLYNTISASLLSDPSYQSFAKRTKCGSMQGLNSRMRVLKYDARDNDRFDAHFDATTFVPGKLTRRKSLVTVLVYLNNGDGDEFEGGETFYFQHSTPGESINHDSAAKVVPKTGRVVAFEHDLFHSGAPLDRGTKYIMRTDILFDEHETCEHKVDGIVNYEQGQGGESKTTLVSEVCADLKFTADMVHILRRMDLLDITCESLLAPGATLMKQMLIDCGLNANSVKLLINEATAIVEK